MAKSELVNEKMLKATGAVGVIRKGQGVQVIYGPQVAVIKSNLETYLTTAPDVEYHGEDGETVFAGHEEEKTPVVSENGDGSAPESREKKTGRTVYSPFTGTVN